MSNNTSIQYYVLSCKIYELDTEAGEMAQQAQTLAPKTDKVNPTPGTYIMEREHSLLEVFF